MRRSVRAAAVAAFLGSFLLVPVHSALAATITVTTTADEGGAGTGCGLRESIQAANTNSAFGGCSSGAPGGDRIVLPAGVYTLTMAGGDDNNAAGDLDILEDLEVLGAGVAATIVDGNDIDRVFDVDRLETGVTVQMSDLTVRNGDDPGTGCGGGFRNQGALTLIRAAVVDNQAGCGGGIENSDAGSDGPLKTLTLVDVLISGNRTDDATNGLGAGINNYFGRSAALTNVTISGNSAQSYGGGLMNQGTGSATLNNTTITGNTADSDSGSEGGGGISNSTGTVTVANSIVAGNIDVSGGDAPDCSGAIVSQGYNLVGTGNGCGYTGATGDKVGTGGAPINPLLGPLADNGGPTQTHALLPGSPAIDAGNPATPGSGGTACAATDQRGAPRNCDMGAYELVQCLGTVVNRIGTATGTATITGTAGADGILGLGANETIDAGAGDDKVCAGAGDDAVTAGDGNDEALGEAGNDTLGGGAGNDDLQGGDGNDQVNGEAGDDDLDGGPGDDVIDGGEGNDSIAAGDGNDTGLGQAGNDTETGGAGNDKLKGHKGNDKLKGQAGKDRLNGGPGKKDRCAGGAGKKDKAAGTCEKEPGIP